MKPTREIMKKELATIITTKVNETFEIMFGMPVREIQTTELELDDDDLVGKITMHQDDINILIRFAFPRSTLKPLLNKIYDPIMAAHETMAEDAVCEIVNIVCTGLKAHLNEQGYNFQVNLPSIDCNFRAVKDENSEILNINFLLDDGEFSIDVNMK